MKKIIFIIAISVINIHALSQIVSSGLAAAYPFSGNANDSLVGTNGNVIGATLATGKDGDANGAYQFTKMNNKIIELNDQIIDQTSDFTIHCWVNIDSLHSPSETNYILTSRHSGSGSEQGGVEFSYSDNGYINFIIRQISLASPLAFATAPLPGTDQWVSLTGKRTADSIFLYINGILADSDIIFNPANHSSGPFWSIGAMYNSGASIYREMDGRVDEILFYDQCLTDCEIYHLYNQNPLSNLLVINNLSCNGGSDGQVFSTPINGIGASTFLWSNGSTNSYTLNIPSGTINLTISDQLGCSADTTVFLSQPPPITSSITKTDVQCNADSSGIANVSASGGTPPFSYNWTGINPNQLHAGQHFVEVIDANGCSIEDSVLITEPPALVASILQSDELFGNDGWIDLTINGGVPAYMFDWDIDGIGDNDDSEDIGSLTGGTYKVIFTDLNGCKDSLFATIDSQLSIGQVKPEVEVFPNPTVQWLKIKSTQENNRLILVNELGQAVRELNFSNNQGIFDIGDLQPGSYYLFNTEPNSPILSTIIKL